MGLLDSTTQNTYYNSSNSANYGDYQFITLENIIANFQIAYVGEGKIISKASVNDIRFHGMRGIQEFSYDILKSVKSQEISVPNTLQMILPQDYVNYVKLTTSGSDGVKRNLYPTSKTSNPLSIVQADDGTYSFSGSASNDFRKITVTCVAGSSNVDGDYLKLPFLDSQNVLQFLYFIFDSDSDVEDGLAPTASQSNIRFHIQFNSSDTVTEIGDFLAKAINDFGKHTATNNNGVVTIVYNQILSSYSNEVAENGNTFQPASFSITVLNAGATSVNDNLSTNTDSTTWTNYKSHTPVDLYNDEYELDDHIQQREGGRYGLEPQHAHINGSFYIDYRTGHINFSSSLSGKTVILDYISDGLGTDAEMIVHKFAEEAIYKWIAHGIIASKSNMPEYLVNRFKKERFAEGRKAKIRLSRIKIEEFTQILKGLSKPIK